MDDLIEKFFNKDCTPMQARQVVKFLNENPLILEKYLSSSEWNDTAPAQMDNEFWEEIWEEIKLKQKPPARIFTLKRIAAAAVVIIALAAGYKALYPDVKNKPVAVKTTVTEREQKLRLNTADKPVDIELPDNSTVILSPGSVITYPMPFHENKREIQLEGEARFKVTHDPSKPFTVYAGGLATTALGTEFTINTKPALNKTVSVRLHTGKVVIKQTGHVAHAWKADVYLYPGQKLEYNISDTHALVSTFKEEKSGVTPSKLPAIKKKQSLPADHHDELTFTGTPLPEVIAKIQHHFHAQIVYDSAELSTMNFTGVISRNDSLPIVLKVIAQMNNLELEKQENRFILKKLP